MQSALVFYFVVTIFLVAYGSPDQSVYNDFGNNATFCRRPDVENTFYSISSVSQHKTYIDLRGQPLKRLPYNAFRNHSSQSSISKIWLQDCHISHVDAGAFLNLHNLTTIDLSHNNITQIDSKLFSDNKRIKFIYMEYNKIEVLPNGLFQNLPQLEVVYLHYNQIRQVERFSFKDTPSLRIIYLNNNQIQLMNMLFKNKFDNLTTLSLYGNPWKCNCELGPLYEFVIEFNRFNLYELECKKPSTLQGRQWSDISRDEFVCRSADPISAQDSGISTTSIEPMTTTEQEDNIFVTVYNGRAYQQVDTGIPQSPVILNWIQYTMLGLVLVCVVAVIIGVVFVMRYTLVRSNRRRRVRLPAMVKQRSVRRTEAVIRVVESGAVSGNNDSGLNTDDDVVEELTSIHHYEIREAT